MSQEKIDQYKKEKANRKANVKKAKTKKNLGLFGGLAVAVIVVGLLVWGIIATIQDGGLSTVKEKQDAAKTQQQVTQEFLEYMNSSNTNTAE